jgi:hypothetical protein
MSAERSSARTGRTRGAVLLGTATAVLALALEGCAKPGPTVQRQVLKGPFSGETEDGRAVEVTFREDREAFRGEGSIGGEPIVVAGAVGWRGVGSLALGDGRAELVELTLSADGESVLLERPGQPAVTLQRGGAPAPPAAGGPFSGTYRAARGEATLAQVTLVQTGTLLAGVGIVAGDAAGITGRTTGPGAAEGLVTFQDGSQVQFQAALAADGGSLTVRGFGEPISMRRGASR